MLQWDAALRTADAGFKLTRAEDGMSRVLVLYGTTEGQTAKIAGAIASTLRANGIEVDVVEASMDDPRADDYAGVVVAASVHASRYQRSVQQWVQNNREALAGKPSAFISVCLGVLQWQPDVQREVNAIVDRFLMTTGWRPMWTKSVAGALPYTKYGWLTRWIMQRIAAKAGGDTDTTRDYEYTDWQDVRAFAERFGRVVAAPVVDRHDSPPHTQAA
jgi:menaquinone-dependent protoporphyrinogen oxidase